MTDRPPLRCQYLDCANAPAIGVAPLDAPTVWLCGEHVNGYLEGVISLVESITIAARPSS